MISMFPGISLDYTRSVIRRRRFAQYRSSEAKSLSSNTVSPEDGAYQRRLSLTPEMVDKLQHRLCRLPAWKASDGPPSLNQNFAPAVAGNDLFLCIPASGTLPILTIPEIQRPFQSVERPETNEAGLLVRQEVSTPPSKCRSATTKSRRFFCLCPKILLTGQYYMKTYISDILFSPYSILQRVNRTIAREIIFISILCGML